MKDKGIDIDKSRQTESEVYLCNIVNVYFMAKNGCSVNM